MSAPSRIEVQVAALPPEWQERFYEMSGKRLSDGLSQLQADAFALKEIRDLRKREGA